MDDETTMVEKELHFPVLKLPKELVYNILSKLPLKTIFSCRCVCRTFLKFLRDPYFAEVHLTRAPSTIGSLIAPENHGSSRFVSMYMPDLDETSCTSSCYTDHLPCHQHCHRLHTKQNSKFHFLSGECSLVGSCNGLLCVYYDSSKQPVYCVCNPILGEYTVLPGPTLSRPNYHYLNHSGFGFCPKTKQYKVIHFMFVKSFDSSMVSTSRTVAEIHTVGTETWRSIGNAPCLRTQGTFDSYLNGALHWISGSQRISNLICSFNLEKEQFLHLSMPPYFDSYYMNKISWINVGVMGGCLCICYVLENAQFMVWVMKDYGFKESWMKEFSIDISFYCGVRAEDFYQPVNFLSNGDLWLVSTSNTLICYSPKKGTFREFKSFGLSKTEVIYHFPSFVSLKDAVVGKSLEVVKVKFGTAFFLF